MSQIMKPEDRMQNVQALLLRSQKQLAMALPKHVTADRMLRVVLTSIRRTPKLLECDPISLLGAVFQAAQLGLEPDGVTGQAYLVPFMNRKAGRMEVQFIPGYRGLIDLARRSGRVSTISARVVHAKDQFSYAFGLKEDLTHKPNHDGDPGPWTFVYAQCRMTDGSVQFEVMSRAEVMKIKARSKSADNGPWVTDEEEMAKKTVLRRLSKMLPVSVEMRAAIALDDAADREITQDLGALVPGELGGTEPQMLDSGDATGATDADVVDDDDDDADAQGEPVGATAAAQPVTATAQPTNGASKSRRAL